jgi:SAM-dependent methyltransferase
VGSQSAALGVAVSRIDRSEGRRLFGEDPDAYDFARPGHPEGVFEVLVQRCGLRRGTSVLEIGPGTGQATRRLLELGAAPLVAVEPDPAFALYLRERLAGRIDVRQEAIEDVELAAGVFALAAAASSFHWVEEEVGLAKTYAALHPGGWIATWWTLFGEATEPDAFMRATSPFLDGLGISPTRGLEGRPPHALDVEARLGALEAAGFADQTHQLFRWTASWDTAGIRALYGTFSPVARLDVERRTLLLNEIARIAEADFGGRVERRLVTSLYTARKPD